MPASELATQASIVCNGESFKKYIDSARIQQRTREIGQEISRRFEGDVPILIGVLNGAFMFLADLMRAVDIECEVDFLKLSSYGAEKISSGVVQELKRIDADLKDRHVIVVEDIVDTGLSMQYILDRLAVHNPASLTTVTLLHKSVATKIDLRLDYVGFEIENLFVIGYGLDFGQRGRNLADIYILDKR